MQNASMSGGKRGTAGKAAALVLVLLAALALALAGCGGGDDEGESAGQTTQAAEPGQGSGGSDKEPGGKPDGGNGGGGGGEPPSETPKDPDPGGGSIEDFGQEATPEQRRQMIRAVKSYFGALADRDPAGACEWVASTAKEQIAQLFEQARRQGADANQGQLPPEGEECEFFLQYAANNFSSKGAPKFDKIKWIKFRVDGDQGFAIYKLPPRGKLFQATVLEDGGWRVGAIDGSPLP